jgi:hypothetical protein
MGVQLPLITDVLNCLENLVVSFTLKNKVYPKSINIISFPNKEVVKYLLRGLTIKIKIRRMEIEEDIQIC